MCRGVILRGMSLRREAKLSARGRIGITRVEGMGVVVFDDTSSLIPSNFYFFNLFICHIHNR